MRIAVISDIHSNLPALEAVLAALGSVDAIWHLGDTVGYGPEPQAVVDRLRAAGAIGVRGNHDDAAGGGSSIECFNPDGYRRHGVDTHPNRRDRRGSIWRAFRSARCREGSDFTLAHGSPSDPIWEYLDSPAAAEREPVRLRYAILPRWPHPRPASLSANPGVGCRPCSSTREPPGARPPSPDPQPGQRGPAARRRPPRELPADRHGPRSRHMASRRVRHRGHSGGNAGRRPPAASGPPAELRAVRARAQQSSSGRARIRRPHDPGGWASC